ncbi:MAG TPA: FAD-dependent oxidoreductase [Deltaproteobacteria bacterium]|mgnify:FL=1|nr:FAD-dependent oxidoreductase [Deltaproteobacteria bacterium]
MPFILRNICVLPSDGEQHLATQVAGVLSVPVAAIADLRIVRKGVDARHKGLIKLVYSVSFSIDEKYGLRQRIAEVSGLEWLQELPVQPFPRLNSKERIVIVGSGPAGLFAALRLADYGLAATLIERGQPVEQRQRDVSRFWNSGVLDTASNVQFGEGGAGTFSDGKLTSRSRDPLVPWVLKRLVEFGAPQDVAYLAKPHIGTDRLRLVVVAIRSYLQAKGFDIRFASRMTDMISRSGRISSIVVNDSEEMPCDRLVLATGHSARDTYEMLHSRNVRLERKAFAMGLRVEHPQELIDRIQYGVRRHVSLPAADYALAWTNPDSGRSAYSFCMCPGGIVIGSASEAGGVVTNGMSGHKRNSSFANSALVVNVMPQDFDGEDPLAGVRFQRRWEQTAFQTAGSGFFAPAQNLMDFMKLPARGKLQSSYRPGVVECDLEQVLPEYVSTTLREGIAVFGKRLKGFISAEANLIGIESRTSAPVRVMRNEFYESPGLTGLYPTGEGAGYAGGIMSSAVDGIKVADIIARQLEK